mmetsp:Transcript_26756/g.48236  ORF Transcript_26756/g.48236 Transcript_26756/m.48236 type:complete len:165 (+) Transcript_26756:463-957(+)
MEDVGASRYPANSSASMMGSHNRENIESIVYASSNDDGSTSVVGGSPHPPRRGMPRMLSFQGKRGEVGCYRKKLVQCPLRRIDLCSSSSLNEDWHDKAPARVVCRPIPLPTFVVKPQQTTPPSIPFLTINFLSSLQLASNSNSHNSSSTTPFDSLSKPRIDYEE